eukprot:4973948-Pyramimonas_sp.AAC.1
MLSLSLSTVSCRSIAIEGSLKNSRAQVRALTTSAHPAAYGVRIGTRLQQKHSLMVHHNHTFARACHRAATTMNRTYALQVRAEEGEEEMMIEEEAREKFEKTLINTQSNFDTSLTHRTDPTVASGAHRAGERVPSRSFGGGVLRRAV